MDLALTVCNFGCASRTRSFAQRTPPPCDHGRQKARSVVIAAISAARAKLQGCSASYPGASDRERAAFTWPIAAVLGLALVLHHPGIHGHGEARAFGWFGEGTLSIDKDPVEPFTLYGSVYKKYYIEKIVDGKVISRKKGFTSTDCVNALDADKETPELQGVPAGLKVVIIGEPLCTKCEGQTREETCIPSCKSACNRAISRHLTEVTRETGYVLDSKDASRALDLCSSQCSNECLKPGKTTSFICPFRPRK